MTDRINTPEIDRQNDRLDALQGEPCILDPFPGRCVIVRDGFKYSGKIIIPDKHRQLPTTGVVVAVGDKERENLLGRRVAWGRYSGVPFQFSGHHCYDVMTYEEVMAFVLDPEAKLNLDDMSGLNRTED